MRALVTGSAGFIGRHMVAELERRGWAVCGIDVRRSRRPGDVIGDVRNLFRGPPALGGDVCWDLVVHCAYHVGGRSAIDGNPLLLAKNLELDAALFDWAVRTGQRRVLYFSSSAAYPTDLQDDLADARPLREDDIRLSAGNIGRPDARYGWAKLTGEQLAAAAAEDGLAVHVVRPFSGYGADQSLAYPFPAIIRRAREHVDGRPFTVWGPPGQTRDWIHVDDVVAGALAVVDAEDPRPVNLCTGVGTEFGDLARMVLLAVGRTGPVVYDTNRPTGVACRVGDPDRMLGIYRTAVTIGEGVMRAMTEV